MVYKDVAMNGRKGGRKENKGEIERKEKNRKQRHTQKNQREKKERLKRKLKRKNKWQKQRHASVGHARDRERGGGALKKEIWVLWAPLFLGKCVESLIKFLYKKIRKNKVQLHVQNTSNVIDKKEYNFGSITLQGFGPSYTLCKSYKDFILVTIYQN